MSAIRTNRAKARDGRFIAPYTRWFSRIFGIQSLEESEDKDKSAISTENDSTSGSRLASHASTSDHQPSSPESNHNYRPPLTPAQYSTPPRAASSSASTPDGEMTSFLSQGAGQSVSAEEVEGMLAILRENTPSEPREIFRFSSTPTRDLQPSPSIPVSTRKRLPRNPNGVYRWEGAGSAKHTRPRNRFASPAFGASPSKQDQSAMKESIDLQDTSLPDSKRRRVGDGSSSSSVSTQRPSVSEPTARKVPFPTAASPASGTNGVTNRPNPLPSPSRLRTPVKPTAPVVPSPLRQTWSEVSSASTQNETRKSLSQTKTANFMAELIKETTPPKKPDLANPYQVASPVGKVGPPRRSTKRPRATGRPVAPPKAENEEEKRTNEETKEKEKYKEYSPQAIIEATVPKGSQRSRPPAHFEKFTDTPITEEESSHEGPRPQREAPVGVETREITYVVEEPDDEEAWRSAKRTKHSANGRGPAPTAANRIQITTPEPEITIEVLEDIDMDSAEQRGKAREQPELIIPITENGSSTSQSSTSPTNTLNPTASRNKLSSAPKEPSKLRFSFQAEVTSVPSSPASKPASAPGLPKSEFKFDPPSANFSFSFKPTDLSPGGFTKAQEQAKKVEAKHTSDEDIKTKARMMVASSLPTFVMTSSATSVLPSSTAAGIHRRVNGLPVSSLPKFELSSRPSFSFGFDPANPKPRPSSSIFGLSSSKIFGNSSPASPGTFSFCPSLPKIVSNSSSPKSSGMFTFGDTNASPAFEATVMKPSVESGVPAIKAFDFAAAGMKVPSNNPETWTCSLCALSNPASALKCHVCDTPATSTSAAVTAAPPAPPPGPPAVPSLKAFDFAAAGMKVPSNTPDTWTCSLCALSNPSSASKCETCDTPATGTPAATVTVALPAPPPAPPLVSTFKAFDFAAAGMKAPSVASGTWICSLCSLSNLMSVNQCETCETFRTTFS